MFTKKHGDVNEVKISVSYGNSLEPRTLIDNEMPWKTPPKNQQQMGCSFPHADLFDVSTSNANSP